ncbi:hypothetical protein M758_6G212500 [Ceratodon purpureus]|uniref:Uncharacterized protein n=1 Tax=Ceratodon purpureus TaxID=3225 RepID=A0A8T0HKB4_CERPU|nr:hypothetical protein KC19_6G221800 [Ceratodon purpureus]KAG0614897.1 hypothetical protein M758_6G212500 [Ceratodon purpureus]
MLGAMYWSMYRIACAASLICFECWLPVPHENEGAQTSKHDICIGPSYLGTFFSHIL